MIGTTPEGYYALTPGSDNFTILPDLLINSPQGLAALDGNDMVFGSTIADIISGNQGDDYLFGNDDNDWISGDQNHDYIDGGAGNDILGGGTGQDTIFGNWGGDSLSGGEDSDLFIVQLEQPTTDSNYGDLILDFNPAEDLIGLRGGFTETSVQVEQVEGVTLVKDSLTNLVLATVFGVTPKQLEGHLISENSNLDIANNLLNGATDLGVLNNTLSINNFVGDSDIYDFYRFTLNTPSEVTIDLTGLSADADLVLYQDINGDGLITDADQEVLRSEDGDLNPETIILPLESGNYFLLVKQYQGDTGYTLDMSATPNLTRPQFLDPSGVPNYSSYYGWGVVDAAKAVALAAGQTTPYPDIPNYTPPTYNNFADVNVMNVPEVWNQGYTGKGVIVAVLDGGVDLKHFDLGNNIWVNSKEANGQPGFDDDNNGYTDDVNGYDFVGNDAYPYPGFQQNGYDFHGTHVAGIIAAVANGNTYDLTKQWNVNGVAYNAQIMPVRVVGNSMKKFDETVAKGIRYAVDNGANVINISSGENAPDSQQKVVSQPEIKAELENAKQQGVTVVISAGNERDKFAEGLVTFPIYPSHFSEEDLAISVGAVDSSNGNNLQFADFSNPAGVKPSNFVVAPGVGVLSTIPGDTYKIDGGTSMAAPYVSGVIALMLEANPNLTVDDIQKFLIQTANPQAITGIEISTVIPPDVAIA